jgi:hypothetical protein
MNRAYTARCSCLKPYIFFIFFGRRVPKVYVMKDHQFKIQTDAGTAYRIRQASLSQGRSVADVIRRAIDRGLEAPTAVPGDCLVEDEGRNRGGKIVSARLSGPISSAISAIAQSEGRSASHVVRSLLRTELRRRGDLSPSPEKEYTGTKF